MYPLRSLRSGVTYVRRHPVKSIIAVIEEPEGALRYVYLPKRFFQLVNRIVDIQREINDGMVYTLVYYGNVGVRAVLKVQSPGVGVDAALVQHVASLLSVLV